MGSPNAKDTAKYDSNLIRNSMFKKSVVNPFKKAVYTASKNPNRNLLPFNNSKMNFSKSKLIGDFPEHNFTHKLSDNDEKALKKIEQNPSSIYNSFGKYTIDKLDISDNLKTVLKGRWLTHKENVGKKYATEIAPEFVAGNPIRRVKSNIKDLVTKDQTEKMEKVMFESPEELKEKEIKKKKNKVVPIPKAIRNEMNKIHDYYQTVVPLFKPNNYSKKKIYAFTGINKLRRERGEKPLSFGDVNNNPIIRKDFNEEMKEFYENIIDDKKKRQNKLDDFWKEYKKDKEKAVDEYLNNKELDETNLRDKQDIEKEKFSIKKDPEFNIPENGQEIRYGSTKYLATAIANSRARGNSNNFVEDKHSAYETNTLGRNITDATSYARNKLKEIWGNKSLDYSKPYVKVEFKKYYEEYLHKNIDNNIQKTGNFFNDMLKGHLDNAIKHKENKFVKPNLKAKAFREITT